MRMMKDEGGFVTVWTTAMMLIFIIITVYVLTYDLVCVRLYGIAITLAPVNVESGYFNVLKLVRMSYNIVPWIMCFGVLIWAYLSSQRKEYETGY